MLPSGGSTRVEVEQAAAMGMLIPDHTTGGYRVPRLGRAFRPRQQAEQQVEQREDQQQAGDMPEMIEKGDRPDPTISGALSDLAAHVGLDTVAAMVQDFTQQRRYPLAG